MREIGNEILAEFSLLNKSPAKYQCVVSGGIKGGNSTPIIQNILKKIEILTIYFDIVQDQNWVNFSDVVYVKKEYNNLKEEIEGLLKQMKENLPEEMNSFNVLNSRQLKILEFLKNKEAVQVNTLCGFFPEVSKRTIRRDCSLLTRRGLIKRQGENSKISYQSV